MPITNEKGSPAPSTPRLAILLNFCHTVVRAEDEHLRLAMGQYQQFLAEQQRR